MTSRLALCALVMLIFGVPTGSFALTWDWETLTKPRPGFTIEFIQYIYGPDGTSHRYIEAYKSDGSYANAGLRRDGTFVVDAVSSAQDRSLTLLYHDVMWKTTHYNPPNTPLPLTPDDATCETHSSSPVGTSEVIGKDVFLGLPVVKHIQVFDAPRG